MSSLYTNPYLLMPGRSQESGKPQTQTPPSSSMPALTQLRGARMRAGSGLEQTGGSSALGHP